MKCFKPYTLNIDGELLEVNSPMVMGILNATPDSFYSGSRYQTEVDIRNRVQQIISEGAKIIDVGGYSSRPMAEDITPEEEYARLSNALKLLREEAPNAIVSVDTFRADVAEKCCKEYGVQIINDISAGQLDEKMFETVAQLKVPYIMMHMRGNPHTMTQLTDYNDLTADILLYFSELVAKAASMGINDIILDPGFGFSKTLDQNYELLAHLKAFKVFELPLLVGVSRKSMIYKLFNTTPQESLNGTTVINTMALLNGASILRVHDVRQAMEAVTIVEKTMNFID